MAMDVTTLTVKVESKGIDSTAKALQGLEKQADNTSKSVDMLINKMSASSGSMQAIVAAMSQIRAQMAGVMPTGAITSATGALKGMLDELKKIQAAMNLGGGKTMAITYKEIGDNSKEAVKGVESLNQSLAKGQNVFQAVGKELYHIRNLLGGTMLAAALGNTTSAVIKMADSWTLLGAKLKLQLGSQLAASMAQEQLYNTAQKLRIPMDDMVVLFNRLVPAMKEYGYSASDAMSVTTTMAAALKVSGATAAEASSVMLQFSQAMQSGRLNGAEFNAIAEGAPIILRLIGQEINKTRGELKKLGSDGVLGIEVITEALKKNEKALVDMAKSVPDTVESSFTNLKNALTKYIGEANNAIGVTGLIASIVKSLAENLDIAANIVKYTLIAAIVGYTASVVAANVASANAIILSNSLATSLGITAASATTAAGGVTIFTRALDLLARHPIIAVLSVIAAGAAYLYDRFQQAANGAKSFENKLAEIDKMKAPEGLTAYSLLIEEILTSLQKENNKLTELKEKRKKAYKFTDVMSLNDAIEEQTKLVHDLANKYGIAAQRKADLYSGETVKRVNDEVKSLQEEGEWLDYQISMGGKLSETEKKIFEKRQEISKASEGLYKQSLVASLAELEANLKKEKTLDAMSKATKKVASEQESSAKKLEKQYLSSLNTAQTFIEKQEEELGLKRKLTESEQKYIELMRVVSDIEGKFKGKDVNELRNLAEKIKLQGEQAIVQEKLNESMDDYFKKLTQTMEAEDAFADSAFKSSEAVRQKLLSVQRQIAATNQTPLGEAMESSEADQRRIDFINKQISATQKLIEETLTLEYTKAISSGDTKQQERVWALMEARQKYIDTLKLEKIGIENNKKSLDDYLEDLFKLSQITMSKVGRSPGQILADGFGEAGNAISSMLSAYQDFGKESKKINEELAAQQKYLMSKGASGDELTRVEQAAADKRMQINAQMFGSMAKSAKGYFNEQSKGYKTLEKAEKAFRTIELALAIRNNAEKMFLMGEELAMFIVNSTKALAVAIETSLASATAAAPAAVANAAIQPGPLAFVGAAAMIALLGGLGIAIAGGGGSGSSNANLSADRQAAAGTGTVFGDSQAKSESVSNALELVAENTSVSAKYNEGMLAALKNIETALGGAAKLITRSNIGTVGSVNSDGGIDLGIMSQNSYMGKVTTNFIDKLADIDASLKKYLLPMLGGDALKKIFGVKVSVKDTGIFAQAQTVSDILEKGFSGESFNTIEKKARFRKPKQEDVFGELPEDVEKQFGLVIKSFHSGLQKVSDVLDVNGEDFNNRLNNFVVDIGRISLAGLSGEEVQKQLTAVFSKLGDEMAIAALPGLENFQEVGEGYLETLVRVASTVATVDGIFDSIGQTMQLTGKSGIDAKLRMVELAGGLQELSGLTSNFYDKFYTEAEKEANTVRLVTEEFNKLGITMLDLKSSDARIKFRDLVNSFRDTNPEIHNSLLNLVDAVDSLTPAFKGAAGSSEALSQKLALENRIQELTMSSVEYTAMMRQKELLGLDSSLRPLQERIWALEDENKASQEALELSKKRQDIELKILSLTNPIAYTVALRQKELASLDESLKPLQERVWALEDEKAAINLQITAQDSLIDSITQSLNTVVGLIGSVDSLSEAGRGLVGLSPKTKTLVESFNDTEAQINSLSETLNTFSGTTALSVTESLAALIEQGKGMSDFQNSLTDSITSLRFESMSLEDRLSSLKAKERKLFSEITSSKDPLKLAKDLQDTINARYSLEKEYQDQLISGQQEINNTSKDTIKQQIDALKTTKDLLGEIRSFTYDLRIGESSILSPQQQLGVASQQFYEVLAKAKEGDTKAQSNLTSVAKTLLDEAKGYYASTTGYVDIFNQVMGALSGFGTTEVIDPQLAMLEKQLTALDNLNISTIDLGEQQAVDLEKVGTLLSGLQAENRAKQEELVQTLKVQIAELKAVQDNQVAQIKQQLAIRDETNALLNDAKTKLTDMRDSLKLLERK